jgi:hydrogenase nickel incorporation protein HypB
MCQTCGCGDSELVPVEVHERILAGNERVAHHNRQHFEADGVLAINLMGSPGSGKTALLEATARALAGRTRLAAVSADLATDNDAQRLRAAGIPARTITTGQACHLDAEMVHEALHDAPFGDDLDVLFIENVGNLVCPAIYDLGQAASVVALSITEGEDKPLKYPVMFKGADLVVLTKMDLLPHLGISLPMLHRNIAKVMPSAAVLEVSARTGQGIDAWLRWLDGRRAQLPVTAPPPHAHTT